jgi:hypothetical protein
MDDQKNRDEIDLLEILLKTVNVVRTNFWLILLFFFLGTGLGVTYFLTARKVYATKMMVSSVILTDAYSKVLFANATKHIRDGNVAFLSAQFNIPEAGAGAIRSLGIENFIESATTTQLERNRFLITAEVTDQSILPALQAGIVQYLENNEFAKIRTEQNRIYFQGMVESVEKEIEDIKEFKAKILSGDFLQNTKGNIMFDPTTVNSKIIELTEKKLTYQNSLETSKGVQIIEGFNKYQNPSKPTLSLSILAGSVVGLFFVGVLIAFKSIRKLLAMAAK